MLRHCVRIVFDSLEIRSLGRTATGCFFFHIVNIVLIIHTRYLGSPQRNTIISVNFVIMGTMPMKTPNTNCIDLKKVSSILTKSFEAFNKNKYPYTWHNIIYYFLIYTLRLPHFHIIKVPYIIQLYIKLNNLLVSNLSYLYPLSSSQRMTQSDDKIRILNLWRIPLPVQPRLY